MSFLDQLLLLLLFLFLIFRYDLRRSGAEGIERVYILDGGDCLRLAVNIIMR
jgi:hypothetical protein